MGFRLMTEAEMEREGWEINAPPVIVLDNGAVIYPSSDSEGNSPGVLFGIVKGQTVTFTAEE